MELLVKLAALGVLGAVLSQIVKSRSPEFSLLIALGIAISFAAMLLGVFEHVADFALTLGQMASLPAGFFEPLLKCVGVAYLSRVTAELCRDAKENAIAFCVDIAGLIISVYLCLPLLTELLDTLLSLM